MTDGTTLIDQSTTTLSTGMLNKLNKEQTHCLLAGRKLVRRAPFSAPTSHQLASQRRQQHGCGTSTLALNSSVKVQCLKSFR